MNRRGFFKWLCGAVMSTVVPLRKKKANEISNVCEIKIPYEDLDGLPYTKTIEAQIPRMWDAARKRIELDFLYGQEYQDNDE